MRSGAVILAGLLAGFLVAVGVLVAFVFVGPDPVGLRPTPRPTLVPTAQPSVASASASASAVASGSAGSASASGGSPAPSDSIARAFHIGQPAPPLVVPQLGGGTIDLSKLKGKAVWVNFMQTTCPACIDEFPRMNAFQARYGDKGLVVIAVDIREDEGIVADFARRLSVIFPMGLDGDARAQEAWGAYALPIHFWIDRDGIVRDGALGGIGPDIMAAGLTKILPGVTVTP